MKQFVVAYLSLFEGELKQELVEARSADEALRKYLEVGTDVPDIQDYATNTDSFISAYELDNLDLD